MPARFSYPPSRRLTHKLEFRAVYDAGVFETRGPLRIFAIPNDLNHLRLGLSVGRPVGIAVRRNLIKRRLREAFRLMQHDVPRGYDLVINVRPHAPLPLPDYQRLLSALVVKLHARWTDRDKNNT